MCVDAEIMELRRLMIIIMELLVKIIINTDNYDDEEDDGNGDYDNDGLEKF